MTHRSADAAGTEESRRQVWAGAVEHRHCGYTLCIHKLSKFEEHSKISFNKIKRTLSETADELQHCI
jgi:hypothetical protein